MGQNMKEKIKEVENEVEKGKSNLGKLFSLGWSVFKIFEEIKHKLIKKGEKKTIMFFYVFFVLFDFELKK